MKDTLRLWRYALSVLLFGLTFVAPVQAQQTTAAAPTNTAPQTNAASQTAASTDEAIGPPVIVPVAAPAPPRPPYSGPDRSDPPPPPPERPATEPAPAETAPPPGYLRLEQDYLSGLQVYASTAYPLTDSVGLAAGIYAGENFPALTHGEGDASSTLAHSWWGEFDVGPSFTFGPLALTPEVGIAFDWAAKKAVALNAPQLYVTVDVDRVHFESWTWTLLYSPFDTPTNDLVHVRNWLTYKIIEVVTVGPELELSATLNSKFGKRGLVSLPVGGRLELLFGASAVTVFLGYQTDKDSQGPNGQAAVGRIAFTHTF